MRYKRYHSCRWLGNETLSTRHGNIQTTTAGIRQAYGVVSTVYLDAGGDSGYFDYSEDSVLLVLASEHYDNAEYIRDYDQFVKAIKESEIQPLESSVY